MKEVTIMKNNNRRSVYNLFLTFIISAFMLFSVSCKNDVIEDDGVFCTEEYAMITVDVVFEDTASVEFECFTIRSSSGDTIRYDDNEFSPFKVVLVDDYQQQLEGKTESFVFFGYHSDSLLFEEDYVIGADRCHVFRVSGKSEIIL